MKFKSSVDENSDEEDQQLEQEFDQNLNKVLTKTLNTNDFEETIGKNLNIIFKSIPFRSKIPNFNSGNHSN